MEIAHITLVRFHLSQARILLPPKSSNWSAGSIAARRETLTRNNTCYRSEGRSFHRHRLGPLQSTLRSRARIFRSTHRLVRCWSRPIAALAFAVG